MPLYAFACTACGHSFDRLQKLSDPDPAQCPDCGAEGTVQRQLTAPSFRLAGSGWYETDFKKQGDKQRNLAGEGGEGAKPPGDKKADATSGSGPGASRPADSKSVDSRPVDSKPVDSRPAGSRPAKADTPAAKPAKAD